MDLNCLETSETATGPLNPSSSTWWVTLTDDHISQTKPIRAQIVFSVMLREGSGGFSEGWCVCGMHSEEKVIASF